MSTKIAINGFGRIGRLTLRHLLRQSDAEVIAINDLADNATLAHLFKYDSAQGQYTGTVEQEADDIIIDGRAIPIYSEPNPAKLPWEKLGVDIVLECTGRFTNYEKASKHLQAGAKRVILSAPAKGKDIHTVVLGVNDDSLRAAHQIVSNASCTTNCLAPVIKVIDQHWGFVQGTMTTTHAYTSTQRLQDSPHKDLRRARAAAFNIIPTSTGAAKATARVYPAIKGKLDAMAIRVPVLTGSLIELTCIIEKNTTVEKINATFRQVAGEALKGILEYTEAPIVSSDIIGNTHSSIFDAQLTKLNGQLLKVVSWYDNEAGYSARLAGLAMKMAELPEALTVNEL